MAEESIINQMKTQKIEPEDADEKAIPNERLIITKVPPKILSRYLSARKESCHDLCKYGIPHAVEAKPWSSTHKWVVKKERKTKVPKETSLGGTKKSRSTSRPSQASKTEKANSQVDIKEVTYEKRVISEQNSPPFEETDISLECNNSDKQAQFEPSLPVQECSESQAKKETMKNTTNSDSSSKKETEGRSNKQIRRSSAGGKEKPTPPSSPLSSKHNFKKPQSLSSKSTKNLTRESSLKPRENVEEVKTELASSDNLPDKILHATEPDSAYSSEDPTLACDASKLSSPSPSPSSSGDKSLKHINKKTGNSAVSTPSKKGLRSVAGNKGKVNMLHRMHSVSQTQLVLSSVSSSNSSLGRQSNATSKSSKRGYDYQGENVKVGYKMRPKMSTKVSTANKVVVAARKLTFRRGKVIEIQPQNNNIPRRLKFRPIRTLGDDMRRDINCAKKRTIEDNKVGGGVVVIAANNKSEKVLSKLQTVEGSIRIIAVTKVGGDRNKIEGKKSDSDEKVVLRHQNVVGKKENPRLYNNMIEETATILAEQRKSKVKALVGAFETVISLDSHREAATAEVSTAC